jgi:hypothetical protein
LTSKRGWLQRAAVEKDRLLHGGHQGMTDTSQHGMVRPDGQLVLSALPELLGVGKQVVLAVFGSDAQALAQAGVEFPPDLAQVLFRNKVERRGMVPLLIEQKDGVEDLQ